MDRPDWSIRRALTTVQDAIRHHLTNDDGDGSGRIGDSDDGANGACSKSLRNRAGRRVGNNHTHNGVTVAVVVTVVVVDASQDQCRCDARAYASAPSMRFGPIGGSNHDHQAEGHSRNDCCQVSRFHWVLLLRELSLAAHYASRLDEAGANGVEDKRGCRWQLELSHNCGSPAVDSSASNIEDLSNLSVGMTFGNQSDDSPFTRQ
jgi:hypothetical protein